MILASNGIIASSIVQFDADALAFFARVTAAGGSLSNTEKTAVNQLVLDLKANSLWTPMKAIYPMVGASAAACAQNLKSSSFTGTFTNGCTFASNGVTSNGTNAYMNTNYNPSLNGQLNSAHLSFYSRTNNNNGNCMIGANDTGVNRHYFGQGNAFSSLNSLLEGNYNPSSYVGFHLIKRENSTQTKQMYNGSINTTSTIVSVAFVNTNLFIFCRSNSGTAQNFILNQCAFASIGDGLTDTEASNFYTSIQAFQTTLSRQV